MLNEKFEAESNLKIEQLIFAACRGEWPAQFSQKSDRAKLQIARDQDIEAWCPSIRSATAIRSGKKRGFCDPSIAAASLGLSPDYYFTDMQSFGFIFECLCMRDLIVYSSKKRKVMN